MSLQKSSQTLPYLGFGLGLRSEHYDYVLQNKPQVDWFELLTENYLLPGGRSLWILDQLKENYPLVMHGVSLSIGSINPIDASYLEQVKQLAQRVNAVWISDHLCWTGVDNLNMHDLLPLPYTEEAIKHVVERVRFVQDYLGTQILLENVSSYVSYKTSELSEWEFLSEIAQRADCLILLDVNNIYVSAMNHGFNPKDYVNYIPKHRVQQIHLAGHTQYATHIIDTHDQVIIEPVWDLYAYAIKRFGLVSTMIERDDNIPEFEVLFEELNRAKALSALVLRESNVCVS